MASSRIFTTNSRILGNLKDVFWLQKRYSQFPKSWVKPVVDKKELKELESEGLLDEISHKAILPASPRVSSSEFYNPLTHKFINYLMRHGKKQLARSLVEETYEMVKRIQVERYHKAKPEDRDSIELDPAAVLAKAVENASPVMSLRKMRRGGITYQVPVPISAERSKFLGMNWLIESGSDKDLTIRLPKKLAYELIDASENKGRVITKKKDLYKQCEANRAYAHYRWM